MERTTQNHRCSAPEPGQGSDCSRLRSIQPRSVLQRTSQSWHSFSCDAQRTVVQRHGPARVVYRFRDPADCGTVSAGTKSWASRIGTASNFARLDLVRAERAVERTKELLVKLS